MNGIEFEILAFRPPLIFERLKHSDFAERAVLLSSREFQCFCSSKEPYIFVLIAMISSYTWGTLDCERLVSPESVVTISRSKFDKRQKSCVLSRAAPNKLESVYTVSMNILKDAAVVPDYKSLSVNKHQTTVPWDTIPFALTPPGGKLPLERWARKTVQVECMMVHVMMLIDHLQSLNIHNTSNKRITVVEFCAGSGFVALPLAHLYKDVDFVLVDRKLKSMDIARERILAADVPNVTLFEGNVEDYTPTFDIGIALHACGIASDYSIEQCIKQRAAFVVCPCCIGKIVHHRNRPLSKTINEKLTELQYKHLVRAADFGHTDKIEMDKQENRERRVCKSLVEEDRRLHSLEHGYQSHIYTMPILLSSPKNDILVGWPVRAAGRDVVGVNSGGDVEQMKIESLNLCGDGGGGGGGNLFVGYTHGV